MKGTVKKNDQVYSLEQAKKLLDVPKEKAENLMIVDLVRHDLHGVCGSGNVQVPRLMVVEEYKSVFQMISVVEGQIPQLPQSAINTPQDSEEEENAEGRVQVSEDEGAEREKRRYTGLDVLAASLPPGSMTGAPKKRSCEILGEIEGRERGLYSGVVGYLDVRGRGDWSVTIRSMFKWDDEDGFVDGTGGVYEGVGGRGVVNGNDVPMKTETWHIGAGGAVTALSTDVGEREEMQTKLNGTLGIFRQLTCLI
jgi:para-aminobenzoate synthetase